MKGGGGNGISENAEKKSQDCWLVMKARSSMSGLLAGLSSPALEGRRGRILERLENTNSFPSASAWQRWSRNLTQLRSAIRRRQCLIQHVNKSRRCQAQVGQSAARVCPNICERKASPMPNTLTPRILKQQSLSKFSVALENFNLAWNFHIKFSAYKMGASMNSRFLRRAALILRKGLWKTFKVRILAFKVRILAAIPSRSPSWPSWGWGDQALWSLK